MTFPAYALSMLLVPFRFSVVVNLDKGKGRRQWQQARYPCSLNSPLDFMGLDSFLNVQASWSNECIDTLNFLDYVMRI